MQNQENGGGKAKENAGVQCRKSVRAEKRDISGSKNRDSARTQFEGALDMGYG